MNNVLLVGNGFDLAHGLLTKYEHFLFLIKHWPALYAEYKRPGSYINPEAEANKYMQCMKNAGLNEIERLNEIITDNSWIHYYSQCEAEIDGWIDFEKEIYPVIELFEFVFNTSCSIENQIGNIVEANIDKELFENQMLRTAKLWKKYFSVNYSSLVTVNYPYVSWNYGILKKKIIENLRKEFEEFIEAFEIYLHEFVYKNDDVKPLKQIKKLGINNVISFNYTLTEKLYGIAEEDVHHLHGMIREDITQGKNNIVMGVSESAEQNIDFIYYVKYFQRIQKASGTRYKELIKKKYRSKEVVYDDRYSLHIYGHSLDETDEDIITFLIGSKKKLINSQMNPHHVTIYYYNSADYEQKVINLIKIYGRKIVELFMERNWFEFVPTSSEVIEN